MMTKFEFNVRGGGQPAKEEEWAYGSCPNCGESESVYRNVRVVGWCQEYFGEDGEVEVMATETLRYVAASNRVRCASCGKWRDDLQVVGYKIVKRP